MNLRTTSIAAKPIRPFYPQQLFEHEQPVEPHLSLLAEAQALSARLAALNELTVGMQANIDGDVEEMLQFMVLQARWVLDFHYCVAVIHEDEGYRVYTFHGVDIVQSEPVEHFARYTSKLNHPRLIGDWNDKDGALYGMRSALIIPLHTALFKFGTLHFYARKPDHYTQHDMRIASALGLQVAAIMQNGRLLREVKHARDELHTILEAIRDGLLVIDLRGRIVLCNKAMQRILGYPKTDIIGSRIMMLLRGAPATRAPLVARDTLRSVWQTIRNTSTFTIATETETSNPILTFIDGRSIEWASVPLIEADVLTGYVLTLRDVSARVALEQLHQDLSQMVVHDLRSPLSSIIMGMDILEIATPNDQMWSSTFGYMRQGANRMLEQINTLLDMNKLEVGRLQLTSTFCNVSDLITNAVAPLQPLAQINQQQIVSSLADNVPIMMCDVSLIRRVLQNLLDNALKFTPLGGTIEISARLHSSEHYVEFLVCDMGPGIPQADQQLIFEKYGQSLYQGNRRGTGLGLTFCRLVADAHQGFIGVRDGANGGSEFWLMLPLTCNE